LARLGQVPGVRFFSLQKGEAAAEARTPPPGMELVDWTEELTDFADTAALIANLDLIITVDTAVAHLAGAMGKPVWTLLSFVADWRWLREREDSPWYPSMRLFRQSALGDWDNVIKRVADQLSLAKA
jgi:ADP-heptose:LPS heptosyltransferase